MAVKIWNRSKNAVVCERATIADTFATRLFGLLGKTSVPEDAGLLIRPSSGVHTFGMRMKIDIVSLDRDGRVLGAFERVGPWKIRGLGLRTKSVLELPSGRIERCGISPGDLLQVETVS